MASRSDLVEVASEKLADARLLLAHDRWSNSYYLYGYTVEISLKAVIAGLFKAHEIPDRKFVDQTYSHDLQRLVGLAGLAGALDDKRRDSSEFFERWLVVTRWTESARYRMIGMNEARAMADAVDNPIHGVLAWLEPHLPTAKSRLEGSS